MPVNEEFYLLLDQHGAVKYKSESFTECMKQISAVSDKEFDDHVDELLDSGVIMFTICKVRRRPFKILREIEITIHDEIARKEVSNGAKNNSCDNLFEEW